jgi:hypothetical protein
MKYAVTTTEAFGKRVTIQPPHYPTSYKKYLPHFTNIFLTFEERRKTG